jgi:hypothetical protein
MMTTNSPHVNLARCVPSTWSLLRRDNSLYGALAAAGAICLYATYSVMTSHNDDLASRVFVFLATVVLAAGSAVFVLAKRALALRAAFARSVAVQGVLLDLRVTPGRSLGGARSDLLVRYPCGGRVVDRRLFIREDVRAALGHVYPGAPIALLVDPRNQAELWLAALYTPR